MLAVVLIIATLVTCLLSSVFAVTDKDAPERIEFSAVLNERFTEVTSERVSKGVPARQYDIQAITLSFAPFSTVSHTGGSVVLTIDEKKINVNLIGTLDYFPSETGYVGVFDGIMSLDNKEEHITIDMLYVDEINNFTAVTIGCAGKILPQILFFGEYSDSISALSAANMEEFRQKHDNELEIEKQTTTSREVSVDATTRFQATNTKTASGYETATISLYHANELRNQSAMTVYAKVNSHTASFEEYLRDVHGFDVAWSSLLVYPDSYMIKILGTDRFLHSNGVVSPTAGSTSQTLTFPAYLPYIGFFTFGVPITMSSTTVDYKGVAFNPIHNDNIITWNIYKRYGWNASTLDGYYDDASGGVVKAEYKYEGNVTSNINATMGAYGSVRYEYIYIYLISQKE